MREVSTQAGHSLVNWILSSLRPPPRGDGRAVPVEELTVGMDYLQLIVYRSIFVQTVNADELSLPKNVVEWSCMSERERERERERVV